MQASTDVLAAVEPPLRVGERASLRVVDAAGRRELIGFLTDLTDAEVVLVDRHGDEHRVQRGRVDAARRVAVSRGRRPEATPRDLLDELAARADAAGAAWVARISDLLADVPPPAAVPAWGTLAEVGVGVRARHEGEWVTLADGEPAAWRAAAWWATRMGARSIQVRTTRATVEAALAASGFRRLPSA